VYENVRFLSLRTFESINGFSPGALGCYLEVESLDGICGLIPMFQIQAIYEHGVRLESKLIRRPN